VLFHSGAELQADALKSRGPEDAFIYAQTLEGIGPFYASLIVPRGSGFADAPLRIPESIAAVGFSAGDARGSSRTCGPR
jgi:hypothetical protein